MATHEHLVPLPIAAQRLAITVQTLRRWHREGKVQLVRLPSGTLRFPSSRLEELLSEDRSNAC